MSNKLFIKSIREIPEIVKYEWKQKNLMLKIIIVLGIPFIILAIGFAILLSLLFIFIDWSLSYRGVSNGRKKNASEKDRA